VQEDALQTHKHLDNGHKHGYERWNEDTENLDKGNDKDAADDHKMNDATSKGYANLGGPVTLGGHPSVRIGDETRPKNAYVNYIIKY
jgi:hypothetical protein